MLIQNPVITGFNPDPCIIRVDDTFYIATSTFEWFPGVQLYKSKNLANWEQIPHPINRLSQLNMIGNDASGGIWAPALSYHDGLYYLVYTDVKNLTLGGVFRDFHNYLITTNDIESGIWSEPIYLNGSGFDPSLFHDFDGKKYLVNTRWDHRSLYDSDKYLFLRGIIIQEYSEVEKKLVGGVKEIFKGTELKSTEAPHIYKKNGYYYLVTAEGGTFYHHAVTVARSKSIMGPYAVHPHNPILTAKGKWDIRIQKTGHASLTNDQEGHWYLAHLCGRPIGMELGINNYQDHHKLLSCILGRETALQKIIWKDDWPYLEDGTNNPAIEIEVPFAGEQEDPFTHYVTTFQNGLPIEFSTLRVPYTRNIMDFTAAGMILKGQESPSSQHRQSVVGFRQKHFSFRAETHFTFKPTSYQQMAGMMYRYDENNYYYLYVYHNDEEKKNYINLLVMDNQKTTFPLEDGIVTDKNEFEFRIDVDKDKVLFMYKEGEWVELLNHFDATIISDENAQPVGFTGAFVALAVHDMSGNGNEASFKCFEYSKK